MQVIAALRDLLQPPLLADAMEAMRARLILRTTQLFLAVLLSALVMAFVSWFKSAMVWAGLGASVLVLLWCLLLLKRGQVRLAGILLLLDISALLMMLVLRADGLYDVATLGIPSILFAASLILTRRGFWWFTAGTLLAIAGVGLLHYTSWFSDAIARAHRPNVHTDLPVFMILTLAAAAVAYVFTGHLLALLGRVHESERQLRDSNAMLDASIAERTEALERASAELDTFVYSISHDLRTPLRAIGGYSRILLEDHRDRLGTEETALIDRIESAALRLSSMTDALLEYSRLNSKPLEAFPVNMQSLVESLREEYALALGERQVEWRIGVLPPCTADLVLIRQVMKQLLGNALKFTERTAHALIEVSGHRADGELVYTVHDNGAGFDAQYAHKLFRVFQRLHGVHEFSGMGVGLATAHRIVVRHGGRMWAVSEPGQGAAFHLALPER